MSEWNMLVWLTQLGLSVAVPMAAFIFCAVWMKERFALGVWIILLGLFLGAVCAAVGFRSALKNMEKMDEKRKSSRRDA